MKTMLSLVVAGIARVGDLFVPQAHAQCSPITGRCITIGTGVSSSIPSIVQGVVNTFLVWSAFIATAVFLIGAVSLVGSMGAEKWSAYGKSLMKAAVIGLAIVLGSWLIVSTVVFFLSA